MIPAKIQQRMCHAKRVYLSETQAHACAPAAAQKAGKPMRAYQCPNCRFWHLTTRPA